MNTDTPRTDAEIVEQWTDASTKQKMVRVEFARELERENTALRNEIARLNGKTRWLCECGGTKGDAWDDGIPANIGEADE